MGPRGSTPPLRAARGLLTGTVCATGTVWAHTTIAGHAPGLVALVAALGTLATCLGLARRTLGPTLLLGVCLAGQGLAHLAMAATMAPAMAPTAAEHAHGQMTSAVGGGGAMLAVHVVVALVTALLAHGGEQALLEVVRRAVEQLLPRLPGSVDTPPAVRPLRVRHDVVRTGRRVTGVRASRAPPRCGAVLAPC